MSENRDYRSNSELSGGINNNQVPTPDNNKESKFKQTALNTQFKKKQMQQSIKDQTYSSQMITSQNNHILRSQINKRNPEEESKHIPTTEMNQNDNNEGKRKGIFEEYQDRWSKNNKKIFRFLITWRVGDDGKIEDQLKLMISYLSFIFIIILVLCGFATTYYFHQTNKENIRFSIENQGLLLENTATSYVMIDRGWYNNTKWFHLNQPDNSTFRVISTPYYDAGSKTRVVTISKAILAPSPLDPTKRYLQGKGQFMGVASVDIKLNEFQELFQDITFYETGYLAIVSNEGQLLNEPAQFIVQINMEGKKYEDLSITQLITNDIWQKINQSTNQLLLQTTSKQGLDIVIASSVNSDNFYPGQSIVIMFIIPSSEVYGAIDQQNSENLKRILISSFISFGGFLIATVICTVYVKKKIIQMVSAITELNQNALKLSQNNNDSSTNSKKEVMKKLNEIQEKAESETIRELVKGFENQLKGISKLGKGGQNILKNGKNVLKYDSAEYCGTNLMSYIEPLLNYLDTKKEKMETGSANYKHTNPPCLQEIPIKTLSSHMNHSSPKKKDTIPQIQTSYNPNDTNLDLLNQQSLVNQTITSPLSDMSCNNKTTFFKNNLIHRQSISNPKSIKLLQNEKSAGESNQANQNCDCSDIDLNENDDINYYG